MESSRSECSLHRRTVWTVGITLCALLALQTATVQAAVKIKEGDEVEVYFLKEWRPGVVSQINKRGEMLVDYEFAGAQQQRVFLKNDVRAKFESGAIARARNWSDSSGKFRIEGAPIALDDKEVTLRKPDMTEIAVPIFKLSKIDQKFVKELQATVGTKAVAGAKGPEAPPLEIFQTQSISQSGGINQRKSLSPDPLPAFFKVKNGGTGFESRDVFDEVSEVVAVGGPDAWILGGVRNRDPREPKPTRLVWVSLEQKKIGGEQLLPGGEVVLDYHAPSRRLLTRGEVTSEEDPWPKPTLTVWEVSPSDKEAKPIRRWLADGQDKSVVDAWAKFASADVVVQRWKRHELVGWSLDQKSMVYRIPQESFFAPAASMSGGRKYLLLPEDEGIRVFESATGEQVSWLPVKDGAAAVAMHGDGRQVAVLGRSTLTVFDVASIDAEPEVHQAESIGTPFAATLAWVGNDRVMADAKILFSLKHNLALWKYEFGHRSAVRKDGKQLQETIGDHLVYAATVDAGGQQGYAIGAVELPGPKVEDVVAKLDVESLMILKPGSAVRLDVYAGEFNSRVYAALEKKIAENGWVLSPDATSAVVAEMKRGEAQQVTYRMFGGGADQTATVTPFISNLRIDVAGQTAWQSGTSSGAPPTVSLKQGETAQSQVDQWQRPSPEFYDDVKMPARILDPAVREGLGTTLITNRGLMPQ